MVSRFFTRRRITASIVTALVVAATGAFAAWVAPDSTGPAGAKAATPTAMTVTRIDPVGGTLFPGQNGDVAMHVVNPTSNGAALTATGVTLSGPVISASPATCPASNVSIVSGSLITLATPVVVPTGAAGADIQVPNAVSLSAAAPAACAGVGFTLTATVQSHY